MEYVWHLNIRQLAALVVKYIQEENPHRRAEVQELIDSWRKSQDETSCADEEAPYDDDEGDSDSSSSTSSSHVPLHDQEKNEAVCMLDTLIKLKAALEQVVPLLQNREAEHLELYDEDFDEVTSDICVVVRPSVILCFLEALSHNYSIF